MTERVDHQWTVGQYTFEAVSGYSFDRLAPVMYRYRIEGQRVANELYESLDRAMVAAVGEKWTGPRGAGGTAVGTAADWFVHMIGAVPHAERLREIRDRIDLETWPQDGERRRVIASLQLLAGEIEQGTREAG